RPSVSARVAYALLPVLLLLLVLILLLVIGVWATFMRERVTSRVGTGRFQPGRQQVHDRGGQAPSPGDPRRDPALPVGARPGAGEPGRPQPGRPGHRSVHRAAAHV